MGRRQPEVAAACAARWCPRELQVLAMEASGLLLLQGEEAPAAGLPRNAARAGVVARLPPDGGAQAVESAVGEEEEDGTGRTKRVGVAPGLVRCHAVTAATLWAQGRGVAATHVTLCVVQGRD